MNPSSEPHIFQNEILPAHTHLVGWSALIKRLHLQAPLRHLVCVSEKYVRGTKRHDGVWEIYDKRYMPDDTLFGHLAFALKYENIDLLILKKVLAHLAEEDIIQYIRATPTGIITRKIWYYYEFLMQKTLNLEDAPTATAIDLLEPDDYFTATGVLSLRHRVRHNLLGNVDFCPIIRKTETLKNYIHLNLAAKTSTLIGKTSSNLIRRAAHFLLLADSRASFEIEGERPPLNRLERWGTAIIETGKRSLSHDEVARLHHILIGDHRFVEIGYRHEGVFLGERDYDNNPIPEFIGAKPEDVQPLMDGLIRCHHGLKNNTLDPVLHAAAIAFGFVYIHPLADGNGRMHRCLIHHVLLESQFAPKGIIFPVSTVMQDRIEDYKMYLQDHSSALMPFIEWKPTSSKNVDVLNDSIDLYRYFDCTKACEFLYSCVQRAVEHDLPNEIMYLKQHDEAMQRIMNAIEMPDQMAQSLILFIRQNGGILSKKRRLREFEKLSDLEVQRIEEIVQESFA